MKIRILAFFIAVLVPSILACGCQQPPTPATPPGLMDTNIAQTKTSAAGAVVTEAEPSIAVTPIQPIIEPSTGSGCIDRAELLSETVVDGTVFPSYANFAKMWILKNTGTCIWTTGYTLGFLNGEQMAAPASVSLNEEVQPDQSTTIAVNMSSPGNSGTYRGNWIMNNAAGEPFGWGAQADAPFWVEIRVDEQAMTIPEPGAINSMPEAEVPATGGGPGDDIDQDGLDDGFEDWIANAFVPILQFSEDETVAQDQIMRFYQVTPIYKTSPNVWNFPQYQFQEYPGPEGILITYVIAYPWDGGAPIWGIESHVGDAEAIRILVVNPRNDQYTWNPAAIVIKRHFDDPEGYFPGDFKWSQSHPIVWVSEEKHAMYSTWEECDDYSVGFEWCGGGYLINYPITPGVDGFNVGERLNHPFARIPNNPRNLFTTEFAWSSPESILPLYDNQSNIIGAYDAAESFCGGLAGTKCGGGLDGKWWPMSNFESQKYLAMELAMYADKYYGAVYGPEYQICFSTGDLDHAGTDYFVNVVLEGTAHSQTFYNLDNPDDNFEKGQTDCFNVGSYDMEERLTGLTIYFYWDFDDDSEWYLNNVTVRNLVNGENWKFDCYCWLRDGGLYDSDIGLTPHGSPISLQPVQ